MPRPLSHYQKMIVEATSCTAEDAPVVEQLMRVDTPTLDHLSRARLDTLAREAAETLQELRRVDPVTADWFARSAR